MVSTTPSGGRLRKYQASGSGVIVSSEGHVVTNHHVAGKSTRIFCRLSNREEIEAELIGSDAMTDIAVLRLKLETRKDGDAVVPVAQWGDSETLEIGQTVLAMGSPAGLSQSVTMGIVANTEMIMPGGTFRLDGERVGTLVRWIGHDAHIYHGNSGGPLVNLAGEVVGINEVGVGGIGGAIPANLARSVYRQIVQTGRVKRSWTGLEPQPLLKTTDVDRGVLVGGVIDGSPAAEVGIAPGDVITEFDGVEIDVRFPEQLPLFNQLVLSTPVGTTVPVLVSRDGWEKRFELTTEARSAAKGEDVELTSWGITARNFTALSALEARRPGVEGVLVKTLREGGGAAEAKPALHSGDVIVRVEDTPVENVRQLRELTRKLTADADEPVPVLVAAERGREHLLTVVKVGKEPERDKPVQAKKAWIGARTQVLTRDLSRALDLRGKKGVRITRILPDGAAEAAGLKVGDIILELDGRKINAYLPEHADLFADRIRQYPIGAEVELGVVRDGKQRTEKLTLTARPRPPSELKRYEDEVFEFTARELGFSDKVREELPTDATGVLVSRVERAGWAALAGLRSGDVILKIDGRPIDSLKELKAVLADARDRKPKRMVFFVKRGIHTRHLELETDWQRAES